MTTNPKFLFKYATRSRPENFFRGLDTIVDNIQTDNYEVLVTCDIDDETMFNKEVNERAKAYNKVKIVYGSSKTKIEAINADVWMVDDWDILVNMSDDMIFTIKAFDTFIVEAMQNNFPDTDGFLHFHDNNQPRLATMSIIGRKHYDRTKNIYHPEYTSVYCDNDAQEYAKKLGKYKYMGDKLRILSHLHPLHGHSEVEFDSQYQRNENKVIYKKDMDIFLRRQEENFGL